MKLVRTVADLRIEIDAARSSGATIGLVPTMGYLHEGHLSLVDAARRNGATYVVTTIFVNPSQFGPKEDFSKYPRDEVRDRELLESRAVDLLFAPEAAEVYPDGFGTWVEPGAVAQPLEGVRRPGHFRGVATVVLKLFNMVRADIAVFGRKDAQQCAVIESMTRDLNVPVRLVFADTVRESDGLALSSRNAYLSPEERLLAPALRAALTSGAQTIGDGVRDVEAIESSMRDALARHPQVELDYLELVDAETFVPASDFGRELLLAGAVRIGRTRLIDNIRISLCGI